jgi:hypothetical protein
MHFSETKMFGAYYLQSPNIWLGLKGLFTSVQEKNGVDRVNHS